MAEGWTDKTKPAGDNTQREEEGINLNINMKICLHLLETFVFSSSWMKSILLAWDLEDQRIPQRFVQKQSQARGVNVEAFMETQRKIVNRFESGLAGYKGLADMCSLLSTEISPHLYY